jgi:hypothetical protein
LNDKENDSVERRIDETICEIQCRMSGQQKAQPYDRAPQKGAYVTPPPSVQPASHNMHFTFPQHQSVPEVNCSSQLQMPQHTFLNMHQQQLLINLIALETMKRQAYAAQLLQQQSNVVDPRTLIMQLAIQKEMERQQIQRQLIDANQMPQHPSLLNVSVGQQSPVMNFLSPPLTQTPASPYAERMNSVQTPTTEVDAPRRAKRPRLEELSELTESESIAVAVLASGMSC